MSDRQFPARPLNENEKLLREKFHINITAQSGLMD